MFQVFASLYSYYSSVGVSTAGYPTTDTMPCPYMADNSCQYQFFDKNYARRVKDNHRKRGRPADHCLTCHTNTDRHVKGLKTLGGEGECLYPLGCEGRSTGADCPVRKWNGAAAGAAGVNWCIAAGAPCHGCTEPDFPDRKSPFFTLSGPGARG